VILISRPNPVILSDIERAECFLKFGDKCVNVCLDGQALLRCGAFDVLPMFIGPGQKKCIKAPLPLVTGYSIRNERHIEMTQVRVRINVKDWRCDVKLGHFPSCFFCPS
jgi:hypothetical protein